MGSRQDERGDEIGGGGGAAAEPAPYCIVPPREEMVNFMAHQQQQHNQNFLIHQQQHGPGPIMWQASPPHIAAPPFPHLQPQPPQQHMYNECYYNLAFPGQPGQPESYSVLPVGPGNFLKVYHCPENAVNEANAPLFTHINMASLNHQHQHPHQQQHHQIQPQTPPQPTPLYELFSANPLLPKPDVNIAGASQPVSPGLPQQQPQSPPPPPQVLQTPNNANLLINNLVNNWSPNLTGGSYIQLGDDAKENATNQAESHPPQTLQPSQQPLAPVQPQSEPKSQTVNPLTANTKPSKSSSLPLATASVPPTAINKAPIVVSVQPEGKKRIVAEVKPMPMSYSDVLSKGTKASPAERELRAANGLDGSAQSQRRNGKDEGGGNREMRAAKRSPMHDAKEVAPGSSGGGHSHGSRSKKRGQSNQNQNASQKQQQQQGQPQQQQPLQQPVQQMPNKTSKASNQEKKRPLQQKNSISSGNSNNLRVIDQKTTSATIPVSSSSVNNNGSNSTSATSASNLSRKQGNTKSNSNSNSNSNSSGPNYNTGFNSSHSNNNNVSSSSSKRYSSSNVNVNSNSSSGYSYSSKRNRNAYSSSNSPTHAGSFASNRNYELAKRILHTWWIYTLKLLTWLFYLVYDIVVLGFSMAYERLTVAYVAGLCYARQLHKELKQNSGKPTIWWRTYWRRFDARFAKNSKWAVWRRFYKRKPPEPSTESVKTGRLPQTGEEAMYSLLNCKGKDAYRCELLTN